jgi:hypothetical protein
MPKYPTRVSLRSAQPRRQPRDAIADNRAWKTPMAEPCSILRASAGDRTPQPPA